MSITRLFFNFVAAWVRTQVWKFRGFEVLTPIGVTAERTGHCNICPFEKDGACTKCGCLIISKALLASERCPIGTWDRVKIKKSDVKPH